MDGLLDGHLASGLIVSFTKHPHIWIYSSTVPVGNGLVYLSRGLKWLKFWKNCFCSKRFYTFCYISTKRGMPCHVMAYNANNNTISVYIGVNVNKSLFIMFKHAVIEHRIIHCILKTARYQVDIIVLLRNLAGWWDKFRQMYVEVMKLSRDILRFLWYWNVRFDEIVKKERNCC